MRLANLKKYNANRAKVAVGALTRSALKFPVPERLARMSSTATNPAPVRLTVVECCVPWDSRYKSIQRSKYSANVHKCVCFFVLRLTNVPAVPNANVGIPVVVLLARVLDKCASWLTWVACDHRARRCPVVEKLNPYWQFARWVSRCKLPIRHDRFSAATRRASRRVRQCTPVWWNQNRNMGFAVRLA